MVSLTSNIDTYVLDFLLPHEWRHYWFLVERKFKRNVQLKGASTGSCSSLDIRRVLSRNKATTSKPDNDTLAAELRSDVRSTAREIRFWRELHAPSPSFQLVESEIPEYWPIETHLQWHRAQNPPCCPLDSTTWQWHMPSSNEE
jgi:hypothetical protein